MKSEKGRALLVLFLVILLSVYLFYNTSSGEEYFRRIVANLRGDYIVQLNTEEEQEIRTFFKDIQELVNAYGTSMAEMDEILAYKLMKFTCPSEFMQSAKDLGNNVDIIDFRYLNTRDYVYGAIFSGTGIVRSMQQDLANGGAYFYEHTFFSTKGYRDAKEELARDFDNFRSLHYLLVVNELYVKEPVLKANKQFIAGDMLANVWLIDLKHMKVLENYEVLAESSDEFMVNGHTYRRFTGDLDEQNPSYTDVIEGFSEDAGVLSQYLEVGKQLIETMELYDDDNNYRLTTDLRKNLERNIVLDLEERVGGEFDCDKYFEDMNQIY